MAAAEEPGDPRRLIDAVRAGDLPTVRALLAAGVCADCRVVEQPGRGIFVLLIGQSPELTAVNEAVRAAATGARNSGPVLDAVLASGPSLSVDALKTGRPLDYVSRAALESRTRVDLVALAKRLLDAGASPASAVGPLSSSRVLTAPEMPVIDALVDLYLARGMDPTQALCQAVAPGDGPLVRRILEAGAPGDARCESAPAVGLAAGRQRADLVDLLLEHGAHPAAALSAVAQPRATGDPLSPGEIAIADRVVGPLGDAAVCALVERRDVALLAHVVPGKGRPDAVCRDGPAIAEAAATGATDLVDVLLAGGADPSRLDDQGRSAFDVCTAPTCARLVGHPLDARGEAALAAAWARRAEPALSASDRTLERAFGPDRLRAAVDAVGAVGWIDLVADRGVDAVAALASGVPAAGWPCALARDASISEVAALLGAPSSRDRTGPVRVVRFDEASAGFLGNHLRFAELPAACDPYGGALGGRSRGEARVLLGAPTWAWPTADAWPLPVAGEPAPLLVIEYSAEGRVDGERVDWRPP